MGQVGGEQILNIKKLVGRRCLVKTKEDAEVLEGTIKRIRIEVELENGITTLLSPKHTWIEKKGEE